MTIISSLIIRPQPRNRSKGLLQLESLIFPVALGKSGMTSQKREGDGATPIITTRPLYGFYRADRESLPPTTLPFFAIHETMGWCDSPQHPSYNQLVDLPFSASHERLKREDHLYDLVVVLDINISRRARGAGSALFMHVARTGFQPTEGCIALRKRDLRLLLAHIGPQTQIHIAR